jgi:O-antigen/teichoic acid export membrane protein
MMKFRSFISSIIQSQIAQYIGIKYLTFGLQFVNSILIAKNLGVYYFGIYSFLLLVNQYLIYTGMGPSYSLNAILATRKNELEFSKILWNNSILLSLILIGSAFFSGVVISSYFPKIFSKYHFTEYAFFILLIFALTGFNNLFVNLYRTYGLLQKINFYQLIIPLVQFIVLFLAKEKELLYYLLAGTIVANAVSLLLFIYKSPLSNRLSFKRRIFSELLTRGFHLLLYNVSFYLILLSSRTIVSIYYTAEELGYYTLAVNLSNAIFMIVGAFAFAVYPKLLNKFHNYSITETKSLLSEIRSLYITSCYILTYLGFFAIPFLELFLPQYKQMIPALKILLLTQLILNNNFGYSILLVAKKKEKYMTMFALTGMILIIVISLIFASLNFSFILSALAVFVGFLYYCIKITVSAFKEIGLKTDIKNILTELFPMYYIIPILILIISILLSDNYYTPALSFFIFALLNAQRLLQVWSRGYSIIKNKESLKF